MILDSSALLALVFREPRHAEILEAVAGARWLGVGAPTLAETGIVLAARLGAEARPVLAMLLDELNAAVVPFEAVHARTASDAVARYGRGRHPAQLNFGDCLAYAVAKVAGEPLLTLDAGFAETDLEPALGGG